MLKKFLELSSYPFPDNNFVFKHLIFQASLLVFRQPDEQVPMKKKQDGRLAPVYFSQEHKYFDQHLPRVKNETIA